MCAGWCGSSIGTSNGWSGSCCYSAGVSACGLGSWGSSAGTSWGWFGGWCGKSTSKSSESELTTAAGLPDFLVVFLPLPLPAPLPLPFVSALCADFVLGFTALGATGMHEGKCTDLDLVLSLPALDVDAVGLSAIGHSTICQKFCCHF